MRALILLLSVFMLASCANSERLQLDRLSNLRFLTAEEVATAQAALPGLSFALTRDETLNQLRIPTSGMAGGFTYDDHKGPDLETIHLSNPRTPGTSYTLLLEYDRIARMLGGGAVSRAKVVIGARIVTGVTPTSADK